MVKTPARERTLKSNRHHQDDELEGFPEGIIGLETNIFVHCRAMPCLALKNGAKKTLTWAWEGWAWGWWLTRRTLHVALCQRCFVDWSRDEGRKIFLERRIHTQALKQAV